VCDHSVRWDKPTAILYGAQDTLCEADYVRVFVARINADLTVFADGEHWFHTEEQLVFYRDWLQEKIEKSAPHRRRKNVHRGMMAMMKKMTIGKKPYEELKGDEKLLADTYGGKVDFTDCSTIAPLVKYVQELI
jgi:hypothetical protein